MLSAVSGANGSSQMKSVRFTGNKPAAFVVDSDSQLTLTVPAGALTGTILVTTAGGGTRTRAFTVTP